MKIVYVAKSFVPSRTANSIHVMNICAALADMGHDVTILLPDAEEQRNLDIFPFYGLQPNFKIIKLYYPKFKGKTIYFSFAIFRALKKIKPDLVVGRFINGCAISAIMNIPTVFDSHGPIWHDSRISKFLFRKMINQKAFKKMTVNSNALKKIYLESDIFKGTKFNTQNLIVAHNGANSYDLNKKVDFPGRSDKLKVGYFGHLYAGRGVDIIFKLAERLPHIEFYIAGGEEADIINWKSKTQLENVHFLGFIPFANVYMYRNSCDVLLAPYQKVVSPGGEVADQGPYMNPIKNIEYMSSKKAIICSDLPTIREVLNEDNAILVDCEDVDQWEKALINIYEDQELRSTLANQAYQDFQKYYTWKIRSQKLIEGVF